MTEQEKVSRKIPHEADGKKPKSLHAHLPESLPYLLIIH